jgi:peptidoglycan/LPS O-acetylase OafA/YrhL
MVVFFHYVGTQFTNLWSGNNATLFPGLYQVSTYGWLGVQFFFLISGFVICMSSWSRSLGEFFVSRTVRLYPVYWFAVILSAGIITAFRSEAAQISSIRPPTSLSDVLLNLTMVQEPLGVRHVDSVYWTLWIEMRFYLLFAIVVWLGVTYRRTVLFCSLWLVATIVTAMSNVPFLGAIVMPPVAPYFIAGIAFYLMYRFRPTLVLWCIVGVCWLMALRNVHGDVRYFNGFLKTSLEWRYAAIMVTLFFAAVGATALGWLSWARWRWLTVAGVLTYPLYLLHQDLGLLIIHGLHGSLSRWVLLPATVVAMLALAWLAHRLVERPLAPRMKAALTRGLAEIRRADPSIAGTGGSPKQQQPGHDGPLVVARPAELPEHVDPQPVVRAASDGRGHTR